MASKSKRKGFIFSYIVFFISAASEQAFMYMYHLLKLNWVYTHTPAAQRQMTAIWRNWAVLLLAAIYLHEPSCATAGWRTPLSRPLAGHLILTPGLDHRWWYGRLDMWYIRCKWNKVVSMEYVIIGVSTKANGRIRHSVKDHQTSIVFHCISFRFFEPLFVVYLMSYLIKILVAENRWENKWCELPTFNHVLCQFRNLQILIFRVFWYCFCFTFIQISESCHIWLTFKPQK